MAKLKDDFRRYEFDVDTYQVINLHPNTKIETKLGHKCAQTKNHKDKTYN